MPGGLPSVSHCSAAGGGVDHMSHFAFSLSVLRRAELPDALILV
jgi:hypothetical protein